MNRRSMSWLFGLLVILTASPAWAQGVLIVVNHPHPVPLPRPIIRPRPRPIPPPPMSYKIKEVDVQARISDQTASVQVSQTFVNTGSRVMEVCFVFPLPQDAAIDRLTFMVDGQEYQGKILPAKTARSIYEGYIRRNKDPALLEWMGMGMFKTSVFPVPPGATRKVSMRYSQLLRKTGRLTDFLFPLSTAKYTDKPLERLSVRATIETKAKLKSVYSPTHDVSVKRNGSRNAVVKFEAKSAIPISDFRLFFDTAKSKVGASVVSYRPDPEEDGYFLLLASPEFKAEGETPPKTVVFVVDRSGSMSGKKIDQAKEALKFVLNNLRAGDTFNIVAYDSTVESFRPELQRYNEKTRQSALGFVEGLYAGGSTNIDGALSAALKMVQDPKRPSYVIFLTDGKPTMGERNESKIVVNAKESNQRRARIVSFGVGYDVNSRLLDRLTRQNYGQSEYVRPDEDIEDHVSRLYSRISVPVLTDVKLSVDLDEKPEEGRSVNRMYPGEVYDLFQGEQLVVVGRYRRPGNAKITIRGKVSAKTQKYDFPAKLVKRSGDQSNAFVEKLWAMRRIGEIIDEIDLHGKNNELIDELVSLSTKHGILTPYTSFLADDNPGRQMAANDVRRRVLRGVDQLAQAEGKAAFSQRAEKSRLKRANQPSAAPGGGGFGGGGIPGLGGQANSRFGLGSGGATFRDIETDKVVKADSVKSFDGVTLYRRGKNVWYAANARGIDLKKEAGKVKVVTRFSPDYFKLIDANNAAENKLLAQQQPGDELVIRLRNVIYHIK